MRSAPLCHFVNDQSITHLRVGGPRLEAAVPRTHVFALTASIALLWSPEH